MVLGDLLDSLEWHGPGRMPVIAAMMTDSSERPGVRARIWMNLRHQSLSGSLGACWELKISIGLAVVVLTPLKSVHNL